MLAECWNPDGTPNKYNFRHECAKVMEAHAEHEPWFGLEQEYTFLDSDDRPYGWPVGGFPAPYVTPLPPVAPMIVLLTPLIQSGPLLLWCRRWQGRPA